MTRNLFTQHRLEHNYAQSLDFYPTPGWATRALLEYVIVPAGSVLEPAAGAGHMSNVLSERFSKVTARDITEGYDFLKAPIEKHDWVITNPPFKLATEFALTGLKHANIGVALLVRLNFLASMTRVNNLFVPHPPSLITIFGERIGFKYGVAEPNVPTATDYCWIVWRHDTCSTEVRWMPACKARLSKPTDYF